jgi:serine/threonine protein kinase
MNRINQGIINFVNSTPLNGINKRFWIHNRAPQHPPSPADIPSKITSGTMTVATETETGATGAAANAMDEADKKNSEFYCKYNMKNQFAKGSYGTVWVATPKEDPDTEYAVKVIDRTLLKEKDQLSVQREVEVLKELQDLPNVIPLVEFLEEPRYLYMVQFYAQGGDLFRRLTKRQQYSELDARDIAVVLFDTLEIMHSRNIVHRDLKPENLLLDGILTEKIYFADFGFARHVPEEGLKTRCGTPAFVAPGKKLFR